MENLPEHIENLIYEIRGQKVMLDADLARMYGIETKRLKESVKRNAQRFEGDDFMFELTKDEYSRCQFGILNVQQSKAEQDECSRSQIATLNEQPLRSQFVTLNKGRGSNIKYAPFAFTELGVAMLSSVLNSEVAIDINRKIMRAFVFLRQLILNIPPIDRVSELQNEMRELKTYIEETFSDYNDINEDTRKHIELINQSLAELQAKRISDKLQEVGYNADRYKNREK
ncbi:MAG: ORF6N domain-containing protein [Paludibacter sp.]|jgi:hypothetical protein|nr:ORF6N domain-containing protein [Paludibacter sp.]